MMCCMYIDINFFFRCLEQEEKFEDPDFPAENDSFSVIEDCPVPENLKWLRPCEIVEDPQFIVDGATRFDVNQGTNSISCYKIR